MRKNMFFAALFVNGFADFMDFILMGLIPGIGDIIDIGVMVINWSVFKLGPVTLLSSVELLPVGVTDLMPVHTATVFAAKVMGRI
tara:strand:+ start:192 stop:446 length:255 start_codon:yes stop_codon:yes gene_type:complete